MRTLIRPGAFTDSVRGPKAVAPPVSQAEGELEPASRTEVRTVCAYCPTIIVDVPAIDGRISHGCCVPCLERELAGVEREFGDETA